MDKSLAVWWVRPALAEPPFSFHPDATGELSKPWAVITWDGPHRESPWSSAVLIQRGPGPTPHLTAAEGGQRGKEDCRGHTACSGEPEEALQPPATLPCAAWENTLLAWQSLSLLSLWLQGFCPRRPNRVWGALPKRWVTHLSEARLAWGVTNRFEHEQFHVSNGWLAAQRWGGGKIMNKESTLTKDPAIEAQLKEIKKTVFKHCPLIGEFF